jgi:hypothetical protein
VALTTINGKEWFKKIPAFFVCLAMDKLGKESKCKVHPTTSHKGPEGEYRYSYTLSLTSALEEGGSSTPRPDRFTPGKDTQSPLCRRLGGLPGPVWTVVENLSPTGIRFPDHPAHSEFYTDYAITSHRKRGHMVTIMPFSLLLLP